MTSRQCLHTGLSAAIHTGSSLDWHECAEQLLSYTCRSVLLVFLLKPAGIQSNKAEETKPLIFALHYKAVALVFLSGLSLTKDQQQLQPWAVQMGQGVDVKEADATKGLTLYGTTSCC